MKIQHDKQQFTNQLLSWYEQNKRSLPWRDEPLPYYVWVSEIMLQQTRVEAVKPYFARFLNALPTLRDLAVCDGDRLAKLWEGLGYYNRVRNMKKCAQRCVEQYDGELPSRYEDLLTLPGIGTYTAGAIASIAFQQRVPAVDGNVLRVFSRVLISEDDILKESTKRKFQEVIKEYLPMNCASFNQALMELGALICVPNGAPRCNICPVASECKGYQSGVASRLPNKQSKKARRKENKTVLVLFYHNQVHLVKRNETGLLANLYEFDVRELHIKKADIEKEMKQLGTIKKMITLPKAKHIFSHIEWNMKGFLIEFENLYNPVGVWASPEQLQVSYAIPTAFKKYRDSIEQYRKGELK